LSTSSPLRKAFDLFVFTSLFIACCALLMGYQTAVLFGLPFPPPLAVFIFSGTVCSYNFHWFLMPSVQVATTKLTWNQRHRDLHLVLAVCGLVAALFAGWQLRQHWLALLFVAIPTFLYSAPMIPHPLFTWLRKVAIGKTIYLAAVWTLVTAWLPLVTENAAGQTSSLLFCINRFFFIYAICILFDYRDVEWDRRAGIRSLITYLNDRSIHLLFWCSMAISAISLALMKPYLDLLLLALLALPLLILALLYRRARTDFSDYLYYFVLDGLMMLSAPLVVLAKFAR